MAAFPSLTTILYISPFSEQIQFKTLTSKFDELGEEKRKQKWLYPRRHVSIGYKWLSLADGRTIWQFYLSRKGAFEAFNFFYSRSDTYESEYVGTGDGSTTIFNLPNKSTTSFTLYKNGIEQTGSESNYTFSTGTGADGADKVTFAAAPDAGNRITCNFTGILKVRSRFAQDIQDFDTFYLLLIHMSIKLKGLLNA